jgi:hypothetical protein
VSQSRLVGRYHEGPVLGIVAHRGPDGYRSFLPQGRVRRDTHHGLPSEECGVAHPTSPSFSEGGKSLPVPRMRAGDSPFHAPHSRPTTGPSTTPVPRMPLPEGALTSSFVGPRRCDRRMTGTAVFPLICLSLGCMITSMAVRSKCPSVQEAGLRRPSVLRDLEARWGRGISNLLSRVPVDRILFGSHFPFFLLDAAVLKLRGSELLPAQVKSITRENAECLLRAF